MRLIDRHIVSEFLGPFVFGIGTFLVVVLGIELSPAILRLLVRDHYPLNIVMRIFFLRLPEIMALTFPMATVFGSLMCVLTLSNHGEVIAMRAGGVSLMRLAAPILFLGLCISLVSFVFNEVIVPLTSEKAYQLQIEYASSAKPMEHLTFSVPPTGEPDRIIHAALFDPKHKRLERLLIMELQNGKLLESFTATEASWSGRLWRLRDVEHRSTLPDGSRRREYIKEVTYDLGRNPSDMLKKEKPLDDMSIRELHRELELRKRAGRPYRPDLVQVMQVTYFRWALPWAALGFALIGVPLGLRPTRSTTGVGLGLSLVIVFAFYVIFNTLNLVGQQGALPPLLTAWLPDAILLGAGITLFAYARR